MVYCTQAESLDLLISEKLPFSLGGKGLKGVVTIFPCFYICQGYETSFYLSSTASSEGVFITYFCVLFPLVPSNKIIGGGRGGGGGGGIIGDQMVWEILLFPFKPGKWGAILVTCVMTWFPEKGKQINICFNYYQEARLSISVRLGLFMVL